MTSRISLNRTTPLRNFACFLKDKAGRNNNGRITVRHQGGGHNVFTV